MLLLLPAVRDELVDVIDTLLFNGGVALPLMRLLMRDIFAALLLLLLFECLGVIDATLDREFAAAFADVEDEVALVR